LELFPLLFAYVLLFGGGLEEPGWRGHLQPVLARTRGTLVAALIVGVIWATWHLPLFVLPGTIQTEMAFWLYLPNVVGLSVILAYLTAAASDSVIPAILLHAAVNSMANYYPIGGAFGAVGTTGYSILTVVVLVVAAAIVVRFGTGGVEARSDPETDPDRDDSPVQSRNTYRPS
jgi:membrane protease YdiL (CAAX protease family)